MQNASGAGPPTASNRALSSATIGSARFAFNGKMSPIVNWAPTGSRARTDHPAPAELCKEVEQCSAGAGMCEGTVNRARAPVQCQCADVPVVVNDREEDRAGRYPQG
jgi:hypothetical protein